MQICFVDIEYTRFSAKRAFDDHFSGVSDLSAFPSQGKKSCGTHEKDQDTDSLGYRKVTHDKPPADISPEEFDDKPQNCIKDQIHHEKLAVE